MLRTLVLLALLFYAQLGVATTPPNQERKIPAAQLAYDVRGQFWHAWSAYKEYAWGHDGLKPLSKGFYDLYDVPFYVTAVDALDSMILMGFDDEAAKTQEFIRQHLSFDKDVFVKCSDFSSHVLGGLIAGFQSTGDEKLLNLAEDLANRLLPAFKSATGMPYVYVNLKTGAVKGEENEPADIGSLLLELGTMTALTGQAKYYNTAKIALLQLYETRSENGLLGEKIDVTTGVWTTTTSRLSGESRSYFDNLVRCALFFGDEDCRIMWTSGIEAVNKYLADTTSAGLWFGEADMKTGKRTKTVSCQTNALFPAALALAGDVSRAEVLQKSTRSIWNHFGIAPDEIDYRTMEVVSPGYRLSPEAMESAYFLYQYTFDADYLSMGKDLLDSLRTHCRLPEGFAGLSNVITREKSDRMESHFLSGTLKYLFLLFEPPETLEFKKVMFNSAGHPFRKTW